MACVLPLRRVIPPDDRLGEVGHAYVRRRPGTDVVEDELLEVVRRHLAGYKVPRSVTFVEELPVTANGKVQKYRLREQATAAPASQREGVE